jgi:hypothetical protein
MSATLEPEHTASEHRTTSSSDTWCNCQAIPGTENYPGPWHEYAGEDHYPCYLREREKQWDSLSSQMKELISQASAIRNPEMERHVRGWPRTMKALMRRGIITADGRFTDNGLRLFMWLISDSGHEYTRNEC